MRQPRLNNSILLIYERFIHANLQVGSQDLYLQIRLPLIRLSSLKTPECLRSYARYLSVLENSITGGISKGNIAGHKIVSSDTTKHLEAHHCSHEGRVTRRVIKQDSGSPITGEDNNVEPKPFTAVDRLDFKDSSS